MLGRQVVGHLLLARIDGSESALWLDRMRAARAEFDATHQRLMNGDLAGPLGPESNPGVRAALAETESAWRGVSVPAGRAIAGGEATDETIAAVAPLERPLAEATESAVAAHVSSYGSAAVPMALAMTISIADRQRALIAAAATHAAFVGYGEEARRAEAASAAQMVSATQTALLEGMPMAGVVAPPTTEIRAALREAGAAWEAARVHVDALADGGPADPATLAELTTALDAPIALFGAAAALYAEHSARAV